MNKENNNSMSIVREYSNWFLFVTVNKIETEIMNSSIKPLSGKEKIETEYGDNLMYKLGMLGRYNVVSVRSEMGTSDPGAIRDTLEEAIEYCNPIAVFLVGVAWGANEEKQNIGDVLIVRTTDNYNHAKVESGGYINRGIPQESSLFLYKRFNEFDKWEFILPDGQLARRHAGQFICGEMLLNDKPYKLSLMQRYKEAIGGDMESFTFATTAKKNNINNWIVIKGICDWGYDKGQDKDRKQKIAMTSVMSLCKEIFSQKNIFNTILKKKEESDVEDLDKKVRINSYKLFHERNSIPMTIEKLGKLCGLSRAKVGKYEKINADAYEDSLGIFPLCPLRDIRKLEKGLNLKENSLIVKEEEIKYKKYKDYYQKRKGLKQYPKVNKPIRALFFDFDGTIVNKDDKLTSWQRIWKFLGYDIELCDKFHRQFMEDIITHDRWCKITEEYFKKKSLSRDDMKEIAKQFTILDDFDEVFESFKALGMQLYIVSGSISTIIRDVLGERCLYFDEISANEFIYDENRKLDKIIGTSFDFEGKAKFIKEKMEFLNISAEEVLFIGNSFNDAHVYLSGARTLCINPTQTNYTNKIYWNDYLYDVSSFKDIKNRIMNK